MAISGLVVTLAEDPAGAAALTVLKSEPRLTLGERFGRRVAVVAETPSARDDRELFDELRAMPGITQVDVTYVHLDTEPAVSELSQQGPLVEEPRAHR